MSNYQTEFLDFLMEDTIGSDWKNLFDLVLTNCRKPEFFGAARTSFTSLDYASKK
jgi:hypothetical protein